MPVPSASDHPICLIATDADMLPERSSDAAWRMRTIGALAELPGELRAISERALEGTRTLDLIGHSTRDQQLLRIGTTAIDMQRVAVVRLFEAIRAEGLLEKLGVSAVRLLGCSTAVLPTGQRTMRRLARTLGIPVHGSLKPLMAAHYTPDGFNPKFAHVLIEASELPNPPRRLDVA